MRKNCVPLVNGGMDGMNGMLQTLTHGKRLPVMLILGHEDAGTDKTGIVPTRCQYNIYNVVAVRAEL